MAKDQITYSKLNTNQDITVLNAHISQFKYRLHAHDDFAVGLTLQGVQSFQCGNKDYQVHRGELIQINPEQPHDGFASDTQGYSYRMVYIPRTYMDDLRPDQGTPFAFTKTVKYSPRQSRAFLALTQEGDKDRSDVHHMDMLLQDFVADLIDTEESGEARREKSNQIHVVEKAIGLMYQGVEGQIDLDDLCKQLGVPSIISFAPLKR